MHCAIFCVAAQRQTVSDPSSGLKCQHLSWNPLALAPYTGRSGGEDYSREALLTLQLLGGAQPWQPKHDLPGFCPSLSPWTCGPSSGYLPRAESLPGPGGTAHIATPAPSQQPHAEGSMHMDPLIRVSSSSEREESSHRASSPHQALLKILSIHWQFPAPACVVEIMSPVCKRWP